MPLMKPPNVAYYQKAGQFALGRSANVEAVTHLERGLELLSYLPETPGRHERELGMQTALGPALVAARGFAIPGVGQAYARAWELCRLLEDDARLPLVLRGRQVFHVLRGELNKAQKFAEQFRDLAERQQNPALLVGSYHPLGQTLFFHGDLMSARRTVEQGIAIFDPERHRLSNWSGGEAKVVLSRIREMLPDISISWLERFVPYSTPSGMAHFLDGLRKAGLSE